MKMKDNKSGHFVGVNWESGSVCFNSEVMTLDEFMTMKGITDSLDIVGPFEEIEQGELFRDCVADFFRQWNEDGCRTIEIENLCQLVADGFIGGNGKIQGMWN